MGKNIVTWFFLWINTGLIRITSYLCNLKSILGHISFYFSLLQLCLGHLNYMYEYQEIFNKTCLSLHCLQSMLNNVLSKDDQRPVEV